MSIQATLSMMATSVDQVTGRVAGYEDCPSLRRRLARESEYDVSRAAVQLRRQLAREGRARAVERERALEEGLVQLVERFGRFHRR